MAKLGSKEEFESQMMALKLEYMANLPERKRVIGELWQRLKQGRFDRTVAQELIRRAHNIVGAAGIHGFSSVADAARDIESVLSEVLISSKISTDIEARFDPLFQRLEETVEEV